MLLTNSTTLNLNRKQYVHEKEYPVYCIQIHMALARIYIIKQYIPSLMIPNSQGISHSLIYEYRIILGGVRLRESETDRHSTGRVRHNTE